MANKNRILLDRINEEIVIKRIDGDTGDDLAGYPKIIIKLGTLFALADANGDEDVVMEVREFQWNDADTCARKRAYVLMSQTFDVE